MSESNPNRGLMIHAGPVEIDVPRSLGYYGGIAVAVGVGMIEPPLGLFIGAVPLVKLLMRGNAPQPMRFLGQLFDGAAKPVGGDGEGTIRAENDSGRSTLPAELTKRPAAHVPPSPEPHSDEITSAGAMPASAWETN